MLTARRSPACSHVDAAHRSLVGNLSSLDVSHRAARANIGDVSRLRWHLRRCVAGASATRSTLRVLAIGCSMTQGQMNCGGKLEGRQCARPCAKLRWATVLQQMLQAHCVYCPALHIEGVCSMGATAETSRQVSTGFALSAAPVACRRRCRRATSRCCCRHPRAAGRSWRRRASTRASSSTDRTWSSPTSPCATCAASPRRSTPTGCRRAGRRCCASYSRCLLASRTRGRRIRAARPSYTSSRGTASPLWVAAATPRDAFITRSRSSTASPSARTVKIKLPSLAAAHPPAQGCPLGLRGAPSPRGCRGAATSRRCGPCSRLPTPPPLPRQAGGLVYARRVRTRPRDCAGAPLASRLLRRCDAGRLGLGLTQTLTARLHSPTLTLARTLTLAHTLIPALALALTRCDAVRAPRHAGHTV